MVKNKKSVLSQIYLHKDDEHIIELDNGVKFFTKNRADTSVIWEVFHEEDYQISVNNPKTIIDIGAHIGVSSVYFALKYPKSKIYSYEPYTDSYERLRKNIKINKLNNIYPFNLAVSNKAGEELVLYKNYYSVDSSLHNKINWGRFIGDQIVMSTSLEEIITANNLNNVDLLKIDCEGSEFKILFNAKKETFKKVKNMVIEYHDNFTDHSHNELIALLEKNNFEVKVKQNKNIDDVGLIYATKL